MNSTAPGEPGSSPQLDAQGYFEAIETTFIELRGTPFLLSPADWQLAREWYSRGIPLTVVQQALHQLFTRRQAEGKDKKLWSLRQCKRTVEAAFRHQQELLAPLRSGELPAFDSQTRLAALVQLLPEGLAAREQWATRILSLEGSPEAIEAALEDLDRELLAQTEQALSAADQQLLGQELEVVLATLAERLPRAELERSREQLRQQLLRQQHALPTLSLFAAPLSEG